MRRWILIASAALCACGGGRRAPSAETTSPYNNASYAFSATTPNANVQGKILVNTSGTFLNFDTPCQGGDVVRRGRPSGMPSFTSAMIYFCGGAYLVFDRRNPSAGAKWFASVESPRSRRVCDSYVTQNGRQVCASYRSETYYVSETRIGGIQVQRILQD